MQVTRFDICYAVNQLARACSRPSSLHTGVAKLVLRYLKGCPDVVITYRKGKSLLVGYGDASFATDPDTQKSTTGYIFMMGGAPVSFRTVTQTLTAQSTVEAELIVFNYTARETVYLSNLLNRGDWLWDK